MAADPPQWLIDLVTELPETRIAEKGVTVESSRSAAPWALDLLQAECMAIEEAKPLTRNDTLNKAAFKLGQMVHLKALDATPVTDALLKAAVVCGLGEREALATIKSGMSAGSRERPEAPFFLEMTAKGVDCKSAKNIGAFLAFIGLRVQWNAYRDRYEIRGLPGHESLTDKAVAALWGKAHEIGFRVEKRFLADCLEVEALRNEAHPVRNYLDQLKWDGIKRLDRWCSTYLGAPDSDYVQAVGSKILIAGVRRIRKPGTKFDQMVIFEGKQGTGKSSAIKVLAIKEEWFTDGVSLTNDAKVLMEQTEGKLIVEIPELKGLRKSDIEHVKATLSRTHDRARKAYGHYADEAPRQFIMFGTVNIDASGECWYLTDPTGNRRFWPIRTGNIDLDALTQDLDQLWAEAVTRERAGESIELPASLWRVAEVEQQGRMEVDPWVEELRVYFADMEGESLKILTTDARQIIAPRNLQGWRAYEHDRLGRAMRELGFERKMLRLRGDGRSYFYVRGSGPWKKVQVYVGTNSMVQVNLASDLDD